MRWMRRRKYMEKGKFQGNSEAPNNPMDYFKNNMLQQWMHNKRSRGRLLVKHLRSTLCACIRKHSHASP